MSSFNAFLGGVRAGQAAQPRRQSAFNEEMAYDSSQANPAFGARQRAAKGAQTSRSQASRNVFSGLETAQREEVRAELNRKSRIVAALSALPAKQQAIGIQTYGKDFGIDAATLWQAAADPAIALATFSSSLHEAESMLEQVRADDGLNVGQWPGADALLDDARNYGNGRRGGDMEPPVTLMAQVADGQDISADIFSRGAIDPEYPDDAMRPDVNRPIIRPYPNGMQSFWSGPSEADRKTAQPRSASNAAKYRPHWNDVSSAYNQVDYGFVAEDVSRIIGGRFAQNKFKNTCASRVSFALNSSQGGFLPDLDDSRSVSDQYGHQTIFAVNDLEKNLKKLWGKPDVTLKKPHTARNNTAAQLGSKPGILLIGDAGSKGGERHATLWTGKTDINEKHGHYIPDDRRLLFWELPTE